MKLKFSIATCSTSFSVKKAYISFIFSIFSEGNKISPRSTLEKDAEIFAFPFKQATSSF